MALVHLMPKGKRQSILFVDGDTVGPVSNSDLAFLSVRDGDEISNEKLTELLNSYILPTGQKKAMELLLAEDRTEKELIRRLMLAGYGESVTAAVMEYVKQYPYINDVRYALNYLHAVGRKKSMPEIRHKLSEKGISDADFESALAKYREERMDETGEEAEAFGEEEMELEAVRSLLQKKVKSADALTRAEKEKLYAFFLRKGFGYHTVRQVLKEYPTADDDADDDI